MKGDSLSPYLRRIIHDQSHKVPGTSWEILSFQGNTGKYENYSTRDGNSLEIMREITHLKERLERRQNYNKVDLPDKINRKWKGHNQ